jgi:DNA-binding response OmpR family regulator
VDQVGSAFKVLVVSDNRDLVELLCFVLERAGFMPVSAADLPSALRYARHEPLDLSLLDLDLGSGDGRTMLTELRRSSRMPILVLSEKASENDKVDAFELGADDYLTKPLSHRELLARLRARIRHGLPGLDSRERELSELRVGPLTLSLPEHLVWLNGRPVSLTATEFRMLHYLMLNAGHVVPTRTLARHVWGWNSPQASNLQRVAIHRLRRKLETNLGRSQLLRTVRGVGVVLDEDGAITGTS